MDVRTNAQAVQGLLAQAPPEFSTFRRPWNTSNEDFSWEWFGNGTEYFQKILTTIFVIILKSLTEESLYLEIHITIVKNR